MKYKHEFIQDDNLPPEYLYRDKQYQIRRCTQEITAAILRDYNFATTRIDTREIHRIELVVLSANKFHQGVSSIERMLFAFRPDLAREVLHIIDQMNEPDNLIEP